VRREILSPQVSRTLAVGAAGLAAVLLGIVTFQRNDDYRTVISIWSDTIAKSPRNARAYNGCGKALMEQGRVSEGTAYYRKALEIDPEYADVHNNLGTIYANRGEYDRAIDHFAKAVRFAEKHRQAVCAEAYNNLGAALAARGQTNEAMKCYEKALQRDPEFAGVYCNIGVASAARGQIAEAIRYYQKALALNPAYAEAEYDLANALATLGKIDEAVAYYSRALEHNPAHADAHHNLGVALAAKGRLPEAIAHYHQALAIQPRYGMAHYHLAVALTKQSHFDEAIGHYRKAVAAHPDVKTCVGLAWLLAACPDDSLRNAEEAVALAEQADTLSRDDPAVLDALAAAYAEARRFDDAVQAASRALRLAYQRNNAVLANLLAGRLELYRAGEPCRDAFTASTAVQQPKSAAAGK
jgi:tetratricopeptide (TPR) repeat protein